MTKAFPKDEIFGLVSQMRRAGIAVRSNMSAGHARGTDKEKLHFLRISSGSLSEIETQLMLSFNLGYISQKEFDESSEFITSVWKQLNALIRTVKKRMPVQD